METKVISLFVKPEYIFMLEYISRRRASCLKFWIVRLHILEDLSNTVEMLQSYETGSSLRRTVFISPIHPCHVWDVAHKECLDCKKQRGYFWFLDGFPHIAEI